MLSHDDVRAALSARVDGEHSGLDDAVVDAHVHECAECRAFWDRCVALSVNLTGVDTDAQMAPPEDLSEVILAGVESEWRRISQRRAVMLSLGQVALCAAAVVWAVWAIGLIVGGIGADEQMSSLLVSAASVRLGVGCALAFAAFRPQQIPGILLVVGTMFTFTLGFVVRDAVLDTGSASPTDILVLLLTLAALVGTWIADGGAQIGRALRMLNADPT